MISYQNPGSNAFSRLKMPKNNIIADNFLIQVFAHVTLKYSAYAKESTLTVYKGNMCKKWRKKIEVRSGERLHLQWHRDTFSQAHDSADSKLKVNVPVNSFSVTSGHSHYFLVLWGVNMSFSRIQHGAASGDRTKDPLIQSLKLYHYNMVLHLQCLTK